ncbi:MAG: response regulator [Nitrospirae bacterium]|nr:response regulator [Nitrospirota bacterium]
MTSPAGREWATNERGAYVLLSGAFVVLALLLLGVMLISWKGILQPRLKREAAMQAEVLARSQANAIASSLLSGEGEARVRNLVGMLDELLLLRDSKTDTPFFLSVELQVDYEVVKAVEGTLDLRRGALGGSGFRVEVALYNPGSSELLGVAYVQVDDRPYRRLSQDVRRSMWGVSIGGLALLLLVSTLSLLSFRRLDRQRAQRERAERELWQQEKRYNRLVNSLSNTFVYTKDEKGRLTSASESVRGVLGFSPDDFIARHRELLSKPVAPADGSSSPERTFEVDLADEGGHPHHIEFSEVTLRNELKRVTGYDGIARDVTAQRHVQEELRHAKDEAESANRAKSLFLANMSHELRTPLNGVVGFTSLALRAGEAQPKVRGYLAKAQASAHLLIELVEDILDLSRIEASRLEIQRIDFDFDDLLSELADVIGLKAADKNLEILFSTAPDVPRRLRGDSVRLKQVLLNLMGNALKFTEQGEIVVKVDCGELRRDHAILKFSVRDTGPGIAPELLKAMFEPFTQADTSMTRRFGGLGLGLAISRRLVSMMGGEMHVESEPGKGSTFSFTATFDLPRGPVGPRRLADEFRNLPVLVADDNANARAVMGEMLRSLLCRATIVSSGPEAVEETKRALQQGAPFRVAVLDWRMPDLDGTETARELARLTAPTRLPVILVTAYDRDEAERLARQAGIEVVLHKPISPSSMHDAIMKVLHPTDEAMPAAPAPSTIQFVPGQSVLLVEDNAINREVAREMLGGLGLEVAEARNGFEALDALEKGRFDAVMMDVQMPEMDGLETVRRMRLQPRLEALPVIALTAHAMMGDRERFLKAGMSDYLPKPIDEKNLVGVMARWLKVRAGGTSTPAPLSTGPLPPELPGLKMEDGLRRVSGNVSLYRRLIPEFVLENRKAVDRLLGLLGSGDRAGAMALLHTLKGSAATLGAHRVAAAAAEAERHLRDPASGEVSLDGLESALAEVESSAAVIKRIPEAPSRPPGPNGSNGGTVRILPLIDLMKEHLRRNHLGALEQFAEIQRELGGTTSESLVRLGAAIDRLDFQSASAHLEALISELGLTPEGAT